MSAMMLHGAFFRCRKLQGMHRRNILRVRVVNQQQLIRINFVHRKQILDGFPEGAKRFVMIQVSDVLADEGLAIHDESDRVLEVRTQSEDGTIGWNYSSRAGGVSAGSAKNRRTKSAYADDGIIDSAGDGSLSDQETVRNTGEPPRRLVIPVSDRFAGTICAGHDQDFGRAGGKQQ